MQETLTFHSLAMTHVESSAVSPSLALGRSMCLFPSQNVGDGVVEIFSSLNSPAQVRGDAAAARRQRDNCLALF